MHSVTPHLYFPSIDLTWSIHNWPTPNAGSRCGVMYCHNGFEGIHNGCVTADGQCGFHKKADGQCGFPPPPPIILKDCKNLVPNNTNHTHIT
jgi:hypothetical protein